jgi:hypothetical protein
MWGADWFTFANSSDDMGSAQADPFTEFDLDVSGTSDPVWTSDHPNAAQSDRQPPADQFPGPPPAAGSGVKCVVRKGDGKEGKRLSPDPHDNYDFQGGPAMHRLKTLGRDEIRLVRLVALCKDLEDRGRHEAQDLTFRNRWAKRRKPCAFHWIDENWKHVSDYFNQYLS